MTDYTKLKVDDIKQLIIEENLMSEEDLNELDVKGKAQWVEVHKTLSAGNTYDANPDDCEEEGVLTFEMPIEDEEEQAYQNVKEESLMPPRYCDVEWHNYVMSQFQPEELVDGKYPNVNGLRRVVELLLGEIVSCGPIDTKTTMDGNSPGKAVVTYEINIAWKLGTLVQLEDDSIPMKTFRALGSSWHGNTDDTYAVFPEAIAETRAEGRALRRALRLGVVCSDELTKKNTAEVVRQSVEKTTDGNWEGESFVTDNQVTSIRLLCQRMGIDVVKFINSGSKQYEDIFQIPRQTAANMIKRLNAYQSTGNDAIPIPSNILIGS